MNHPRAFSIELALLGGSSQRNPLPRRQRELLALGVSLAPMPLGANVLRGLQRYITLLIVVACSSLPPQCCQLGKAMSASGLPTHFKLSRQQGRHHAAHNAHPVAGEGYLVGRTLALAGAALYGCRRYF